MVAVARYFSCRVTGRTWIASAALFYAVQFAAQDQNQSKRKHRRRVENKRTGKEIFRAQVIDCAMP
jgi:hypothetical protein